MAKVIYENPLSSEEDVKELVTDGEILLNQKGDSITVESYQQVEGAFWIPKVFPADIKIEWEFRPIAGEGCSAVSFAVKEENAFHILYCRRGNEEEKTFHVCNMIKDPGSQVVAIGADPLPDANGSLPWYRMTILKKGRDVAFWINDLEVLSFHDDEMSFGELLTGGNVGFRQFGSMTAEYRNLCVTWI